MLASAAYAVCVFLAVWNGSIIILNLFNDTMEDIAYLNILMMSIGITGIILHGQ